MNVVLGSSSHQSVQLRTRHLVVVPERLVALHHQAAERGVVARLQSRGAFRGAPEAKKTSMRGNYGDITTV